MRKEISRKKVCIRSKKNDTASNAKEFTGGDYFCDYSPRYTEAYNIYEKAKEHAKKQKIKNLKKVVDNEESL